MFAIFNLGVQELILLLAAGLLLLPVLTVLYFLRSRPSKGCFSQKK